MKSFKQLVTTTVQPQILSGMDVSPDGTTFGVVVVVEQVRADARDLVRLAFPGPVVEQLARVDAALGRDFLEQRCAHEAHHTGAFA